MLRNQFAVGWTVLLLGVAAIVVGSLFLPHAPVPLTGRALISPSNSTLPATVTPPSNATVPLVGVTPGSRFGGNFTVDPTPLGGVPPVSFFLLNRSDWATYNATSRTGDSLPISFVLAVANRSSSAWNETDDGGVPYAMLYVAPEGGAVNLTERAYGVAPGGGPTPLPVPGAVALSPQPSTPGRLVVPIPLLDPLTWGIGGAFRVSGQGTDGARLYLVNGSYVRTCPAARFLPGDPACEAATALEASAPGRGGSTTWFLPVHGLLANWSMVFLSTLTSSSFLTANATAWELPPGPVLDSTTVIVSVGATIGFFGFLAWTGAFIVRPSVAAGPRSGVPAVHPSTAPAPVPRALPAPGRSDITGPASGIRTRGATPRGPRGVEARPGVSGPALEMGPGRPAGPPAVARPAAVPRMTCGICGTGYPIKGGRPRCPVCGSSSVVYAPATGVELL